MKILLVEDDLVILEDIEQLILKDHEVITASNLNDGLQKVSEGNFDLLVSDWKLGGRDTSAGIVKIALEKGIKTVVQTLDPDNDEIDPFRKEIKVLDKFDLYKNLRGYVEEVQKGLKER